MANEAERISALEAQFVANSSQLDDIKGAMIRLEAKLDAWHANYVPRVEINEMFRSRDEKIAMLHEEIEKLHEEKKVTRTLIPGWAQACVALAAAAISVWDITHRK